MATKAKSSAKSHRAGQTPRWSQHVTETSDAMHLQPDVFTQSDPKAIARSVKSSAEHGDRHHSGGCISETSVGISSDTFG